MHVSRALAATVLAALTWAAPVSAAPVAIAASDAKALRKDATAKYKAKKYEEACALFARAAKAAPEDAALQADLGLCLAKLGRKDEAIAANRSAISLTLRTPNEQSFDDVRTRKNASYNLWTLGAGLTLPPAGKCGPLTPAPGCDVELHACTYEWSESTAKGTAVRLGGFPEDAQRDPRSTGVGTSASLFPLDDILLSIEQGEDEDPHSPLARWGIADFAEADVVLESRGAEKGTHMTCAVVYGNACPGVVLAACTGDSDVRGAGAGPAVSVREAWIIPRR